MDGPNWLSLELKWRGHKLLSALREPTMWEKTKASGGVQIMLEIGKTIITDGRQGAAQEDRAGLSLP